MPSITVTFNERYYKKAIYTVHPSSSRGELNFKIEEKKEEKTLCESLLSELEGVDISSLKLDSEFIKTVAELIENQISNKNKKADEKIDKL